MERYDIRVNVWGDVSGPQYEWETVKAEDGVVVLYTDAQATVEALQAVIRQMGEQAAVLAKDGMAAKAQVEALQRELESANALLHKKNCAIGKAEMAIEALQRGWDEAIREHGKESGFWGRTCARLLDKRDKLQAALDAELEKVANTEKAYQEKARLWIEQTGALAQLQALVRAIYAAPNMNRVYYLIDDYRVTLDATTPAAKGGDDE